MSNTSRATDNAVSVAEWGREHGPAVRGYLLAMVRDPHVADDLAQEVFFRAWRARERYQEQGYARAYLLRIADRLVIGQRRRARREVQLGPEAWQEAEPSADDVGPSEAAARHEALGELAEALDTLTPMQRRVLLLRYYGQLSFAEIAATVECPLNTVLSHCHRGLEALRKLMVEKKS
jgi:RNA polymerase sigma-70 factor, ECF subfamily